MSVSGYLSLELNDTREMEAFILPNISFEAESVFLGGLLFSQLSMVDWSILEKSQYSDDLRGRMLDGGPFFCLFTSNEGGLEEAVVRHRSTGRKLLIKYFISALRLSYPGNVETPVDYITYRREGGENIRDAGRFGRNAYNLSREYELAIKAADYEKIEKAFFSLKIFYECRSNIAIVFALYLFEQSYEISLIGEHPRMLYLLSSLEALLGDHADEIGLIPWKDEEINAFCAEYKRLRNAVAHGSKKAATGQVEVLRRILRVLLNAAITHELEFPGSGEATGALLIKRLKG